MSNKKKIDIGMLGRVLQLTTPYRTAFISSCVLAVLLAPLGIAKPYMINLMVDDYIFQGDIPGLIKMSIILIILLFITAGTRYVFIYITNLVGQKVIRDLRVKVFKHVTGLNLSYFDKTAVGTSTTRTINDIETINNIFTQGTVTIIADLLGMIAVLIIMFITSIQLTLICLITLPFMIIAGYIFKEKAKASFQVVRNQISKMNAFLNERITGMKIVQIFNAEHQEMEKFKIINREYTQANLNTNTYYAIFYPVVELISAFTLALMVWWGARGALQGDVTIGALVAFPIYISMLFRPVRLLADRFNTLQMGLVAAERVFGLLDRQEIIPDQGTLKNLALKGALEFENVYFSYDGIKDVLKGINFSVKPGTTLAVVGSTGSGKTTIINLINRFYNISRGHIRIDGRDIQTYDLGFLRSKIAIVLQDVFLFTGSVFDNITLRNENITRQRVIAASKIIGADTFITKLPGGYDFIVMERGNNLSMGQRQLISFVRALVFDPEILILDEATSSVDTETESVIQNAIETLIKRRTSIIIAHRLSTIRHAEKIMVLDQGKVVELGSHEELLNIENGHYRNLYDLQFSELISV